MLTKENINDIKGAFIELNKVFLEPIDALDMTLSAFNLAEAGKSKSPKQVSRALKTIMQRFERIKDEEEDYPFEFHTIIGVDGSIVVEKLQ